MMIITKGDCKRIINEFSEYPKKDFEDFIKINGNKETYLKNTLEKFVGFWLQPDYF